VEYSTSARVSVPVAHDRSRRHRGRVTKGVAVDAFHPTSTLPPGGTMPRDTDSYTGPRNGLRGARDERMTMSTPARVPDRNVGVARMRIAVVVPALVVVLALVAAVLLTTGTPSVHRASVRLAGCAVKGQPVGRGPMLRQIGVCMRDDLGRRLHRHANRGAVHTDVPVRDQSPVVLHPGCSTLLCRRPA
jgi:hypothetical protein